VLTSVRFPHPSPTTLFCSASGQSSQERKKGLISKLIVSSKGSEPGYIIRSLQVRRGWGCCRQLLNRGYVHTQASGSGMPGCVLMQETIAWMIH
jgi:hypothetical protein